MGSAPADAERYFLIESKMRTYFDCSGSVSREAFELVPEDATEVFLFDSKVYGPYSRQDAMKAMSLYFGGTDYREVWAHLESNPTPLSVMVITDGFGPDLELAPSFVKIVEIPASYGFGVNKM